MIVFTALAGNGCGIVGQYVFRFSVRAFALRNIFWCCALRLRERISASSSPLGSSLLPNGPSAEWSVCRMVNVYARSAEHVTWSFVCSPFPLISVVLVFLASMFLVMSILSRSKGLVCFSMMRPKGSVSKSIRGIYATFAAIGVAVNSRISLEGVSKGGYPSLVFISPFGL